MIVLTTYQIDVTAEDIRLGNKRNADWCPIARAATRILGVPVCIGVSDLCVHNGKTRRSRFRVVVAMPEEAVKFSEAFDEGVPVEPFTFAVRIRERQ